MPAEGLPQMGFHVYDEDNNYIESTINAVAAEDQARSIGGVVVSGGDDEGRGGEKLFDFREKPPAPAKVQGISQEVLARVQSDAEGIRVTATQLLAGLLARPDFVRPELTDTMVERFIALSISSAQKLHAVCAGQLELTIPEPEENAATNTGKREYKVVGNVKVALPREG